MLITGTKGDYYHKLVLNKILKEGTLDINPRPHYSDGLPAHTYSINHIMQQYDLSKGECPVETLRPIAWKSAVKEILWIYQMQSNKINDLHEMGIKYWDDWDIGDGTIGCRYGATVKRHNLMNKLLNGLKQDPFGRRHIMNMWQEDDFSDETGGTTKGLNPCCYETIWNPVDGLVVASDDYKTADALPVTGHHPNRLTGFAFKWADECVETTLREIEWSPSRTGRINPVAVFDPVQLEGTTVTRASVHNVSIVKKLRLRVGDKISVFKANKIIPCIDKNLTPGDELTYAESHACTCPVCGMETSPMITHSGDRDVEVEMCTNPNCAVKQVKKFVHFCERDCMDIVGLSEKTLEKFIEKGFIKQLADLYRLDTFERNIAAMDGFGQKSYDNIWKSIQISRKTTFVPFIHALGIPMVGKGQAKLFDKAYKGDVRKFFNDVYNRKCFTGIDGIGEKIELSLWDWGNKYLRWIPFEKDLLDEMWRISNNTEVYDLLKWIDVEVPAETDIPTGKDILSGKTFVITGSVNHFKNRAELQAKIEELGGKATGSVTGKTSYLINNDVESTSGKNKKAKELGVPIISEDEFLEMIGE